MLFEYDKFAMKGKHTDPYPVEPLVLSQKTVDLVHIYHRVLCPAILLYGVLDLAT